MTESNHGFKICVGDLWSLFLLVMPPACLSALRTLAINLHEFFIQ